MRRNRVVYRDIRDETWAVSIDLDFLRRFVLAPELLSVHVSTQSNNNDTRGSFQ